MSCHILIPRPCHEDWNAMTPNEKGRHCSSCDKTVVDFTRWALHDVAAYLQKYRSYKVCGRFHNSQLGEEVPYDHEQWVSQVGRTPMSWLQKTALIFLFAFGVLASGCGDTGNKDSIVDGRTTGEIQLDEPPLLMGKITMPDSLRSCKDTGEKTSSTHWSNFTKQPDRAMASDTMVYSEINITAGAPVLVDPAIADSTHAVITE